MPTKTIKFANKKLKLKFKKKYTKLIVINCPTIAIHLRFIYIDFLKKVFGE